VIEAGRQRIRRSDVDRLSASLGSGESRLGLLVNNLGGWRPWKWASSSMRSSIRVLAGRNRARLWPGAADDVARNEWLLLVAHRFERLPPPGPALPCRARRLVARNKTRAEHDPAIAKAVAASVFQGSANEMTAAVVQGICDVLIQKETELNALDAKVGRTATPARRSPARHGA